MIARPPLHAAPIGVAAVDLYWLPLGAGGHFVRLNGRIYEAIAAGRDRRRRLDLYHSALEVRVPEGRYVLESAPIRPSDGADRGVVGEGPVGSRRLARFRIFRYELRCWRGGVIPDLAEAVESPRRLSTDEACAREVLRQAREVPTPVWGRDELNAGEMWNSNSYIAWLLTASGLHAGSIEPPRHGRAPGWNAGLTVAQRARMAKSETSRAPDPPAGRTRMVQVENAIEIACPPEEVFAYSVDLTREPEWNPKARRVDQMTEGSIGIGTRFEAEFMKGAPMTIEFVRFEPPNAWETVAHSARLDAKGAGTILATEYGAWFRMRMQLTPKGPLKLILPILGRFMHRQQERNLAAIKRALEPPRGPG